MFPKSFIWFFQTLVGAKIMFCLKVEVVREYRCSV